MHMILDGTGQGYYAQVNEDNQLYVKPFPNDLHQRSQETGRAFSGYIKRDVATANTEEPLGTIEYNGAGRLVVVEMKFSLSISDMTDYQGGRIEVHTIDGQSTSNGTVRAPIGMNRGNQQTSDALLFSGDSGVITGFSIDVTTEVFHCYMSTQTQGNAEWLPQDAYLMEKGDKLLITAKGYTAGTALPGFRCTMRWYEENLDTK
jgi:hypothetical protein